MAKKSTGAPGVTLKVRLLVKGGAANPSPPVGPILGAKGVNIMDFCKQFNARTQDDGTIGKILPVVITVYPDKSFVFIIKRPPATNQLLETLGEKKGSPEPNRKKIGRVISEKELRKMAKEKMSDMNAFTEEAAMRMLKGSARSAGIVVADFETQQ